MTIRARPRTRRSNARRRCADSATAPHVSASAWSISQAARSSPPKQFLRRMTTASLALLVLLFQRRDDIGVCQCRGVAERATFGDVAQEAAHDLARSCLRQVGAEKNVVGAGDGADLLVDEGSQLVAELGAPPKTFAQPDECRKCLPLELVCAADDGSLRDRRVLDERRFDFHRTDAVASDV